MILVEVYKDDVPVCLVTLDVQTLRPVPTGWKPTDAEIAKARELADPKANPRLLRKAEGDSIEAEFATGSGHRIIKFEFRHPFPSILVDMDTLTVVEND